MGTAERQDGTAGHDGALGDEAVVGDGAGAQGRGMSEGRGTSEDWAAGLDHGAGPGCIARRIRAAGQKRAEGQDGAAEQDRAVRGRPRSEAVARSIIEGVLKLLEDGIPLGDLSIEGIARTAGVGKATIYRRWPGKEDLFVDVLRAMEPEDPPLPGTSLREDLIALLEAHRQRGLAKRSSAMLHNVFAQMKAHPKLWDSYHAEVIAPRRRVALDLLRRGMRNGELRDDLDPDLVNDLFLGPMLLRSAVRPDAELPEGLPRQIVDTLLEGLRPPADDARSLHGAL